MRVAIYGRVSTDDQSCERQQRDLTAYAARAGWEVVGTFLETASGARSDRSVRKQVIELARRRQIEGVLVSELTRWGRSTTDLLATLEELQSYGVSLIAHSGFQFDLTTPIGKMIATVLAGLSEFERDLIRERVKSGLAAAKARGKHIGRQKGLCPAQKKHRAKILARRSEGMSYRQIAQSVGCSKGLVELVLRES